MRGRHTTPRKHSGARGLAGAGPADLMVEDRKDLRFAPSLRGAPPTRERSPAMGDFARVSSAAVHRPFAPVRGTVRTSPKALESQHLSVADYQEEIYTRKIGSK